MLYNDPFYPSDQEKEAVLSKIRTALNDGKVEEAQKIWEQSRWNNYGDKRSGLMSLWDLATEVPLHQRSKQWLESKIPLMEKMGKEAERENFFDKLAMHNPELLEQVIQDPNYPLRFITLKVCLRRNIGDVEAWNRLMPLAFQRNEESVVNDNVKHGLAALLGAAIAQENYRGIKWVLDYNPHLPKGQLLALGFSRLNFQAIDTDKFRRILTHVEYQNIDWNELAKVISNGDFLAQIKAVVTKNHLELTVNSAGNNKLLTPKVHL